MRPRLCWVIGACLSLVTVVGAAPVTNRTDEAAIIADAVPGVRSIQSTAYGYRVETTNGPLSVFSTSRGIRGQSFEASRMSYGYRVKGTKDRAYFATRHGYNLEGGGQISRTSTGYELGGGTLSSNATGFTYRPRRSR